MVKMEVASISGFTLCNLNVALQVQQHQHPIIPPHICYSKYMCANR